MKIESCPFCGDECVLVEYGGTTDGGGAQGVACQGCTYSSEARGYGPAAIAAHNRVSRAVTLVKLIAETPKDVPGHRGFVPRAAREIMGAGK